MSDTSLAAGTGQPRLIGLLPGHGRMARRERLPRAGELWVQATLDQRQRFQQLFFPEGISFDGTGFVRTAATTRAFNYLRVIDARNERVVDQTGIEPVTS